MTTPATASSLREATSPEARTRARRRLLTAHPDPTSSDTPMSGSLTDEQLRVLAAHDWAPPRTAALDTNTLTTAAPITRALLAESVRETLERRLAAERPHGTYDDTRAGHDAFSRGVVEDYDHGNHHLARATIRSADPGLVTRAALSALGLPDTDTTIIDELAQASDTNPIMRVLADAALLDLDRYATGAGLRYSRVGTTLMLAAPNDQRLAEAIDAVAAAAINAGARLTDVTTQYIDEEKALASIGIDPWVTRPSDEPTGKADRILYVGRARVASLAHGCAHPPTSGPAWRWTSWNSSAHSWSSKPSWHSCAGANSGPNTASSRPRPGECGWEPTAKNPRRRLRGRLPAIRHRCPARILGVVAQTHHPLRANAGARHRRTRLPVGRDRLAMIYISAYDIADNKRRLRVAKTLESWGYRIQESVFQLRLDSATLARVRLLLAALISDAEDVIHIYPICSSCADRADILGAAIALDDVGLCRGVW